MDHPNSERLLLKIDEVARLLSMGRTRTYRLIATGELPGVRIGRSVRVSSAALRRWLAERESESEARE